MIPPNKYRCACCGQPFGKDDPAWEFRFRLYCETCWNKIEQLSPSPDYDPVYQVPEEYDGKECD